MAVLVTIRHMRKAYFTPLLALLLSGCVIRESVESLQERSPPPEYGRPGWVRACAGFGGWVGGIGGGIVSIVLLPITWPISLLADDGLGEYSTQEFLFFPAVGGAAIGHCVLGTPPDLLDYVFRRAWVSPEPLPNTYEMVPMEPRRAPGEQPVQTQRSAGEGEPGDTSGR